MIGLGRIGSFPVAEAVRSTPDAAPHPLDGGPGHAAEPYIDAHCHIWTPDVDHYPLAEGYTVEDMKPRSFTAEELLEHCRPCGVGRVNLIQMSFYHADNSYMLDMIRLYPDRFVGTAIVDPTGPDPAAAMAGLSREKGVRAFRILPGFVPLPVDRWLQHRAMKRCSPGRPSRARRSAA